MATASFPTKEEDFNSYLITVIAYLNTPAVLARLLISAANMSALNLLYTNPTGATVDQQGWLQIFALHINPATKNKNITTLLHKLWRKHLTTDPVGLENLLRAIFADIPASLLTPTDYTTLKLTQKKAAGTHKVATKNTVNWSSVGISGGDVHTKCWPGGARTLNPSASASHARSAGATKTRAHKEAGYNLRTIATIIKQGTAIPTLAQMPNADTIMPAGWVLIIDTKASIVHHFGAANVGSILVEFKQWHNSAHPDLDGPWSGPETTIIT